MEPYSIRAIFFVDTTCLLRMKEKAASDDRCREDFEKIADQLRKLVRMGHYIYPHIHPHWLDAEFMEQTGQWRLRNISKYRFHHCSIGEREQIFSGSVAILKEILHPEFPDYHINGYRAGGWCIQPFAEFYPLFQMHDFRYEFSVMKPFYQFTDAQYFDFSVAPDKDIYHFEDDVCVEQHEGRLLQFTISSLRVPPSVMMLDRILLKLRYKLLGDHTFHKGEGQPSKEIAGLNPVSAEGRNLGDSQWERVAVELLTSVKLGSYLSFMDRHHYMHFISHPKMITRHNLKVFDKFLKKVFNKYRVETDFHRMIPR